MSEIVTQNPGSSEIQSPIIAGITEALNKISSVLSFKVGTLTDVELSPVSIDEQETNKNRIYEAPLGSRLWLSSPAPVIKKNGFEITQSGSNFTIDYVGGSITFLQESKPSDSDKITVSCSYIIGESELESELESKISSVSEQANKYKGNFDSLSNLKLSYPTANNGDFSIVFSPLAVFAWKDGSWQDTRSVEDLSVFYTKVETDNKLNQKEPSIQAKGSTSSDDNYYYGGRKTWQSLFERVRAVTLSGLSTASDAVVSATDTVLVALGKLQAQVSKATQRAYLSGTGAPSTSTVGVVGQRYVNTSNGDEYTCEEVSGDTYTWRLHTRSVNNKRPNSPGGNINLVPSDIGAATSSQGEKADSAMQPSVYDTEGREEDIFKLSDRAIVGITVSLPSSGWVGESSPYSQTISVDGMTPDRVFSSPTSSDNSQGIVTVSEALSLICGAESGSGSVTVYATDKPEIDLSVILRG